MGDENIDTEKEFPGLYGSEASYKSDSDYADNAHESGTKELLRSKKKERNKVISYATLGGDSSTEEMDSTENRVPIKAKKPKSFKFLQKRDREDKEDKKEERKKREDKEDKKKEKKREKEERKKEKEEKKRIKKDRKKKGEDEDYLPVFGTPLAMAVDMQPSHDGIRLPVVVRECIDFIEENGLDCEGIYRLGGMKSKIQSLRRAYNSRDPVNLEDQNPHVVASLLKQYLRELPETVLTIDMMAHFEDVSLIPNPRERSEAMRQLIDRLPTSNRLLLQYVLKHMGNVINKEKENKMSYQNICIVLSPTMQISHRVLNVMFLSHQYLFHNVKIKRHIHPISSHSGTHAIEELKSSSDIAEEIDKQESLLDTLHNVIASDKFCRLDEERLWEAQRIVTLLKRKLKSARRREENPQLGSSGQDKDLSSEESQKEGSLPDRKPVSKDLSEGMISGSETDNNVPKTASNNTKVIHSEETSAKVSGDQHKKMQLLFSEQQPKDQIIPILPKPVSAKEERNKLSQTTVRDKRDIKRKMDPVQEAAKLTDSDASDGGLMAPQPKASKNCAEAEYETLLEEEMRLQIEHEELLGLNHDLTRKLQTEKVEITRLREEIQEMQTLYGYRTHSYDSSESGGSDSEGERETEDDVLKQIVAVNKSNCRLQCDNSSLAVTIQNEREKVLQLRVSLRQIEAKTLPQTVHSTQPLQAH